MSTASRARAPLRSGIFLPRWSTLRVIDQVIARDPSDEVRPNAVIDRLGELIEARDLNSADLILLVRGVGQGLANVVRAIDLQLAVPSGPTAELTLAAGRIRLRVNNLHAQLVASGGISSRLLPR